METCRISPLKAGDLRVTRLPCLASCYLRSCPLLSWARFSLLL